MKLLFDHNLSPRLPHLLSELFPESQHVRELARRHRHSNLVLCPSTWIRNRFEGLGLSGAQSVVRSSPEIHLAARWQCPAKTIEALLRKHATDIERFNLDATESHLILS